jgi:ElaB/YqjD/DUF883 family membrane-anchored ribosome-binding protein
MDMATLLKRSANVIVGVTLMKLVAGDLIRRSPYPAAGAAAVAGLLAGLRLGTPRNSPTQD